MSTLRRPIISDMALDLSGGTKSGEFSHPGYSDGLAILILATEGLGFCCSPGPRLLLISLDVLALLWYALEFLRSFGFCGMASLLVFGLAVTSFAVAAAGVLLVSCCWLAVRGFCLELMLLC